MRARDLLTWLQYGVTHVGLKNKILCFSYEEEGEDIELSGEVKEQKEQEAKDLIL